jgi:hypothetical protein
MTELSPGTRNILNEGTRALAPSQAARDRIRAGVAARVTGPTGGDQGGGTSGAAVGSATSAILKGSLITIVAVVLVGGALWLARHDSAPAPVASRAPAMSAPEPPAAAASRSVPARAPRRAAAVKPPPDDRAADRRAVRGKADRREPPRRTERDASELAREVQLIDRARRALADGDPDAALTVLASYRREIAAPQMEREALLLQAEAECAAARTDDGLRILARVEARWPRASGVSAVRGRCRERSAE